MFRLILENQQMYKFNELSCEMERDNSTTSCDNSDKNKHDIFRKFNYFVYVNSEIGELDSRIITTEYISRAHRIHM